MSKARDRIVFGVLLVVLGAALFEVASSFMIEHGGPIVAAIVGVFTFPILPVVWHAIGERRRSQRLAVIAAKPKAKAPKPSTLSGVDRFWLRFGAVALVVIGSMVAVGRYDVVGSVWRHGLWFVPTRPIPTPLERVMAHVPGDAELVVAMREAAAPSNDNKGGAALFAWGKSEALFAVAGKLDGYGSPDAKKRDEINAGLKRMPWLKSRPVAMVVSSDTIGVYASEGWRMKTEIAGAGPSAELRTELEAAPAGALYFAAFVPKTTPDAITIKHGAIWAVSDAKLETLAIEGHAETRDAAAAAKLVGELTTFLKVDPQNVPEACREPVTKLASLVSVMAYGTSVVVRANVPTETMSAVLLCVAR